MNKNNLILYIGIIILSSCSIREFLIFEYVDADTPGISPRHMITPSLVIKLFSPCFILSEIPKFSFETIVNL